MYKYVVMFALCILIFIGCTSEKQEQAATDEVQVTTEQAATAKTECDGECGMSMEQEKMIAHVVEGDTLHFCSDMCKENHLASKETSEEKTM